MPTTWTPALDVMQGSALQVARAVEEMTGGRLRIEVFPAGQIVTVPLPRGGLPRGTKVLIEGPGVRRGLRCFSGSGEPVAQPLTHARVIEQREVMRPAEGQTAVEGERSSA